MLGALLVGAVAALVADDIKRKMNKPMLMSERMALSVRRRWFRLIGWVAFFIGAVALVHEL